MAAYYLSHPRMYRIWRGIKYRTLNKSSKDYAHYGGRGIRIDPSWMKVENFIHDMSYDYKDGLTIDRIDNDGDYCRENCRWVTISEQNSNQNRNIKFNGETAQAASRRLGGGENLVTQRLHRYKWPIEKAFNVPARPKKKP